MENHSRFPYFDRHTIRAMRILALQILRVVIAAGLAGLFALGLNLPQVHWSMISALVVVQGTYGATVRAGRNRILATGCGAALGAVAGIAHAHGWPASVTWAIALVPTVAIAHTRQELRITPVTAVIVATSAMSATSPLVAALLRIGEISLGALVGVAASRWLLPVSAQDRMRSHAVQFLSAYASLATGTGDGDDAAKELRTNHIRSSLREITLIARELQHENDLTRSQATAFAKNLRRLHDDLTLVERISIQARSQAPELVPLLNKLDPALRDMVNAARSQLLGAIHNPLPDLPIDMLIPRSAPGIDDTRITELKTMLRFAVKSMNRQLQAISAQTFNSLRPE